MESEDKELADLMSHFNMLIRYWEKHPCPSEKYRLEGFLHSVLVTFDGMSGQYEGPIDLVKDGVVLNEGLMMHDLYYDMFPSKEL